MTVCPSGQTRGSDGSCVAIFSPITFEVYPEDVARLSQYYYDEGIEIWRESLKIPSGATIKLKWNQENNYYKHYYNNSNIGIKLPEGVTEYTLQVLPTERMYNPRACGEDQDDSCTYENISADVYIGYFDKNAYQEDYENYDEGDPDEIDIESYYHWIHLGENTWHGSTITRKITSPAGWSGTVHFISFTISLS